MKYYEVWGWDTFAGEDYFCGRYTSYEEAERVIRKKEKEVESTQDKELQDVFSIVEITDEGIRTRDEEQNRISWEKADERFFDPEHLANCVHELLEQFSEAWKNIDPKSLKKMREEERVLKQEVNWSDERDCFTQIAFESFCAEDERLIVGISASIRDGKYYGEGCISSGYTFTKPLTEMLLWARTKKAQKECTLKFQELIDDFFRK